MDTDHFVYRLIDVVIEQYDCVIPKCLDKFIPCDVNPNLLCSGIYGTDYYFEAPLFKKFVLNRS